MKINFIFLLFLGALFSNCSKDNLRITTEEDPNSQESGFKNVITGYNVRWRNTPDFATSNVETLIDSLQTGMFRYPGGTVTHKWNWQTGQLTDGPGKSDVTHLIGDIKNLADSTNAKVAFVLDVVKSSIEDQINMLNAANVPVEYIELGNELYAPDYIPEFPTGAVYADTINSWVPKLRANFPNAKIGAVLLGRYVGPSNPRSNTWNTDVYDNITEPIDAHIYHIYNSNTINGGTGEDTAGRLSRLDQVFINDNSVETWITEYGDKSQDYNETLVLADALVKAPYNATVLLNHCVIAASGNFTKIEQIPNSNNYTFTAEGLAFINKFYQQK